MIKIIVVILSIVIYPLMVMWALNQLFDTGLTLSLANWVALVIMSASTYPLIAKMLGDKK